MLWGGKYWRPYTIPGLLGFSPLPFVDRIRMGAVLAFLKAWPKVDYFERHTAADWLRRMMGARAFGVLWEPLLRAKFGTRADDISLACGWGAAEAVTG
ncbi:MAG: hypothetical protein EBV53_12875 [Proteobacteria bacterium]|nr:hypothetical protein [Pseudomonadota bacterium]